MKLSTRSKYGISAMLALALNEDERPMPINQIAERQGIPEPYLEQLAGSLKRSGLVISTRGAMGGYTLGRPAESISIGDVIRALEGSLSLMACVEDDDVCQHTGNCSTHMLYARITGGINGVFDSITLADLVSDQRSVENGYVCACRGAAK